MDWDKHIERHRKFWQKIAIVVLLLTLACGGYIFKSHVEAQEYTRLTGRTVTTWQAMWLSLRLDCD